MNRKILEDILNSEMMLATGCTEPACIALCAAYARQYLETEAAKVRVLASTNIIKNAMAVGLPGMHASGINYAAALGAVCGSPERQLQVMDRASEPERQAARALVSGGHVQVERKETSEKLYVEIELRSTDGHRAKAIIATNHTNLIYAERDGKVFVQHRIGSLAHGVPPETIQESLSIPTIWEYINTLNPQTDDVHMIEQAISINCQIAREGSEKKFNLCVGQNISSMRAKGYFGTELVATAMECTACGIDARMGGAESPVVTNSGSGNQGIIATLPLVVAAEYFKVDHDRLVRAVTLSHLVAIYIHCQFGLLSALCGATVAGVGAACGLTYLMGGNERQVGYAINNIFGTVTGMLCDGAKADCAMKAATCVNAAFLCASMAVEDVCVQPNEGIVEQDPEQTIRNFAHLGNTCSPTIDNVVLDIMLHKKFA